MEINPPFGYREIVPFLKTQRVRLPSAAELPAFTRQLNAIPVSYAEFGVAGRDYPLVFASGDEGKTYAPLAVLGIGAGENLFLNDDGWAGGVYVPAYVRRYPFCMARVTLDAVEQQDRLICVEKAFVAAGDAGEAMFDDKAQATPRWTEIQKLLNEYEADLDRTREMCSILADYGLFEPFTMQATVAGGAPMNLTGMHRVNESRLEFLTADQLRTLVRKGLFGRIYAHLLSLDNFGRLLDRRAARGPAPAAAPA
ncbi:MAG: SapC family protein [Burkholderiales bacterium]|nr:SapC family protein [Burkholderiales bacterium]